VTGKGIVQWKVETKAGDTINLDFLGYHIPNAEVRLLSPQVFLSKVGNGAKVIQTPADLLLCLGNDVEF